jgi:hypothetical protein
VSSESYSSSCSRERSSTQRLEVPRICSSDLAWCLKALSDSTAFSRTRTTTRTSTIWDKPY